MTNFDQIKRRFLASRLDKKILIIGGFLTLLAVFLPWYSDMDNRNISSQFWGLSGPFYLGGLFILLSCLFSLVSDIIPLFEKKHFLSYKTLAYTQLVLGLEIFSLTLLAVSIYFHPEFGLGYLSTKTIHLGIYFSFSGSLLMLSGAAYKLKIGSEEILLNKEKVEYEESKPEIDLISTPPPAPVVKENRFKGESELTKQLYRVERTQHGIETRVRTIINVPGKTSSKIIPLNQLHE